MLEGLDRIDWGSLEHANGEASDVPKQILALVSPEAKQRDDALWTLYGNIFHQGSRYQATAPAVPFLFEIAENPLTPDRHRILDLLVHLAVGYPAECLPFGIDPDQTFDSEDEEVEASAGHEIDDEDETVGDWKKWLRTAYEAVETGVGLFIKWAHDPDAKVREAAIYALAWFPRRAKSSAPVVRRIAQQSDITPAERANAVLSLALLDRAQRVGPDNDIAFFTGLLTEDAPPVVRLSAAIALGVTPGSELPAEAAVTLRTAVRLQWTALANSPDGEASEYCRIGNDEDEALPWNDGDLIGFAGMVPGSTTGFSTEETEQIVDALCAALPSAVPMSSLNITQALLDVALGSSTTDSLPRLPSILTPLQTKALRAIADHGAWRVGTAHFANYRILVAAYGLPGSENELREFVQARGCGTFNT